MLQHLVNETDVDALLNAPGPVLLLKHSNACSISSAALDEVTRFLGQHPEVAAGMVVVQTHRPLSNLVSNRLKMVHQSPQLFLLQGGRVRWSATHWSITADALTAALTRPG
jgi:bacillithiol system protein YtxJ